MSYFLSEICKHRFSFQFWSESPNVNRKQPKSKTQAIWKVRGQKRKSVTHTHTASSSQRRCHSAGLWHGVLHGVTRLTRVGQPGVFSVHARATRGFPRYLTSVWAWRHACTAQRPTLPVSHEPLPTVCLYSQVPLLFFLLSRACFLPLTLVFLVTDNCLAEAFWLGCSDGVRVVDRRQGILPLVLVTAGSLVVGRLVLGRGFPGVGDLGVGGRGFQDAGDLGVWDSMALETWVSPRPRLGSVRCINGI